MKVRIKRKTILEIELFFMFFLDREAYYRLEKLKKESEEK